MSESKSVPQPKTARRLRSLAKCRVVLWDLDRTLTDSLPLIYEVYMHLERTFHGREISREEINARFGPPDEELIKLYFEPDQVFEVLAEFHRTYKRLHPELCRVYPGITNTLQRLQQAGFSQAVVTAKGRWASNYSLQFFGLERFFDFMIAGEDVRLYKPHPDGIQQALARFQAEPAEALMVGDSRNDVQAAHSAGVPVALALWGYDQEHLDHKPADADFYLDSPEDLLPLLLPETSFSKGE